MLRKLGLAGFGLLALASVSLAATYEWDAPPGGTLDTPAATDKFQILRPSPRQLYLTPLSALSSVFATDAELAAAVAAHAALADPHTGYVLESAHTKAAHDALGINAASVGGTTPTTYGKSLIDDADAAAARTTLGLTAPATAAIGTGASDVAAGDAPAAAVTTHVGQSDPHTGYLKESDVSTSAGASKVPQAGGAGTIDEGFIGPLTNRKFSGWTNGERLIASNAAKDDIEELDVTTTEARRLSGVTSNLQAQLDAKSATTHAHAAASGSGAGFVPTTDGVTTGHVLTKQSDGSVAFGAASGSYSPAHVGITTDTSPAAALFDGTRTWVKTGAGTALFSLPASAAHLFGDVAVLDGSGAVTFSPPTATDTLYLDGAATASGAGYQVDCTAPLLAKLMSSAAGRWEIWQTGGAGSCAEGSSLSLYMDPSSSDPGWTDGTATLALSCEEGAADLDVTITFTATGGPHTFGASPFSGTSDWTLSVDTCASASLNAAETCSVLATLPCSTLTAAGGPYNETLNLASNEVATNAVNLEGTVTAASAVCTSTTDRTISNSADAGTANIGTPSGWRLGQSFTPEAADDGLDLKAVTFYAEVVEADQTLTMRCSENTDLSAVGYKETTAAVTTEMTRNDTITFAFAEGNRLTMTNGSKIYCLARGEFYDSLKEVKLRSYSNGTVYTGGELIKQAVANSTWGAALTTVDDELRSYFTRCDN